MVICGQDEAPAVRAEGQAGDPAAIFVLQGEAEPFLPHPSVPDPEFGAFRETLEGAKTARGQGSAVGAEGDRINGRGAADERSQFSPGIDVPQPRGPVHAAGDQTVTVVAKGQAVDAPLVAAKYPKLRTGASLGWSPIPNTDSVVGAR